MVSHGRCDHPSTHNSSSGLAWSSLDIVWCGIAHSLYWCWLQVAILANGTLRAYGTPLFLRNRFGSGYHIKLLAVPHQMMRAKEMIMR